MKVIVFIIVFIVICFTAEGQANRRTCSARKASTSSPSIKDKYDLYSTSGNLAIDQVTTNELLLLQSSFLVYPIFFFYDDNDGKNAKATDEVLYPHGPDGTVIFGKRFFNREYVRSYGGTSIPIVIAHEYAHIVDYKYGVLEHASSKKRELFADVFAGMYMAVRSSKGWFTNMSAVYQCFEELGDTDFGSEDNHGTPTERNNAVGHGYNYIFGNLNQGIYVDLNAAIREASRYVSQFPND